MHLLMQKKFSYAVAFSLFPKLVIGKYINYYFG